MQPVTKFDPPSENLRMEMWPTQNLIPYARNTCIHSDATGFRGKQDIENPVGEWNRTEVICDDDTINKMLNGKVVNYGTNSSHAFGKIQLRSEGGEIWFRRVELQPLNE